MRQKSWVTNTTAVVGLALLVYGMVTERLDFDHAIEAFLMIGGLVGMGRKLDRLKQLNEGEN